MKPHIDRRRLPANGLLRSVAWLLILLILNVGPSRGGPPNESGKIIDPFRVDVAATQAKLGADPGRLFDYVRTVIRTEPYRGLMRGGQGSLVSQAGNSVDKSVLLYELLKSAGIRARYVHGILDDAHAAQLLDSMVVGEASVPSREGGEDVAWRLIDAVAAKTAANYNSILKAFSNGGFEIPSSQEPVRTALLDSVKEHYWVQYFDGSSWIDLDPSFPGAVATKTFAAPAGISDSIPPQLFHRVTIRVILEEKTDAGLQRRQLLTYHATAADLSGQTLFLTHVNASWEHPLPMEALAGGPFAAITQAAVEDRVKPVLIVGADYLVGDAFDITAQENESAPAAPPIHSLSDLASAIGGPPPITAIGEWIELEFVSPDGTTDIRERTIFDRLGFAARQSGSMEISAAPLGLEHPHAGFFALSFYSGPLANSAVGRSAGPLTGLVASDGNIAELSQLLEALNHVVALVSDGVTSPLVTSKGQASYFYASPRLIVSAFRSTSDLATFSIDLRRSDLHPMPGNIEAFRTQMIRGVIDGIVESEIMDMLVSDDSPKPSSMGLESLSTSNVFRKAAEEGIAFILISKEMQMPFAAEPAARISADLRQGRIIVAPQSPVNIGGEPHVAWWSVAPKTGDTIAVTETGLHGDTMEYVVVVKKDTDMATVFVRWTPGKGNFTQWGKAWEFTLEKLDLLQKAGWGKPMMTTII